MATNTREVGRNLEKWVVSLLQEINPKARLIKGSGSETEKGDIYYPGFKIECKQREKENLVIEKKVWQKLINSLNIYNGDIPLLIMRNKHKDCFAILNIKDFINLLKEKKNA